MTAPRKATSSKIAAESASKRIPIQLASVRVATTGVLLLSAQIPAASTVLANPAQATPSASWPAVSARALSHFEGINAKRSETGAIQRMRLLMVISMTKSLTDSLEFIQYKYFISLFYFIYL